MSTLTDNLYQEENRRYICVYRAHMHKDEIEGHPPKCLFSCGCSFTVPQFRYNNIHQLALQRGFLKTGQLPLLQVHNEYLALKRKII